MANHPLAHTEGNSLPMNRNDLHIVVTAADDEDQEVTTFLVFDQPVPVNNSIINTRVLDGIAFEFSAPNEDGIRVGTWSPVEGGAEHVCRDIHSVCEHMNTCPDCSEKFRATQLHPCVPA